MSNEFRIERPGGLTSPWERRTAGCYNCHHKIDAHAEPDGRCLFSPETCWLNEMVPYEPESVWRPRWAAYVKMRNEQDGIK